MATIRTAIQVNDMMSQQFRAMNMAMSTVIDSFHTLQDATSQAVDVAALEAAQRELQQVEASFNQIEQEIRQAENSQERLNRDIDHADNLARSLLGTLGAIAGTYLTLQGVGEAIKLSDQMTNIEARLNLVLDEKSLLPELEADVKLNLSSGNKSEIDQLQQMIFDSAQRSYASYADSADLVGKLGLNAGDAFKNTAEIVTFAELLNKQFSIAGTNAEGVSASTQQLIQALGSGVLRGEELNSVFEAAPTIIHSIADYLGVGIGQIREMASEGEITAEIVKASMFAAADDINNKFNSMPVTFEQIWTNFKNEALWAFQDVLKQLSNLANSNKFKEFVQDAKQQLYTLASVTMVVLNMMADTGEFIYDNWGLIAPIVGVATAAIGAYGAALLIAKAATIASTIWTGAKILALGLMTASSWAGVQATMRLTAAQWGLNAALMANPVFIVVLAIIALIGVLYLAVAAVNHFAGTSISATGIIAGVFMLLYAHIYNIVAQLWNTFAAFWEFFANVGKNPVYAVKKLFYNLATNFIDSALSMSSGWDGFATNFVNAFVWAVNGAIKAWNWFVGLLPDEIASKIGLQQAGEFSYRTSVTSDLNKIRGALDGWIGDAPEDYWEAPKMDYKNYSDSWNTGYDWGANLFNGIDLDASNAQSFDDLFNSIGGLQDAIGAGNMDGKDTAGNTKKLADSVDMATEDLAYLRDIAERESINRYTTGNIKIEMKNDNHINNEMDIDGIIDRFAERLEEAVETVAEDGDNLDV